MKHLLIAALIAMLIILSAVYGIANGRQTEIIYDQRIRIGDLEMELENRPSKWELTVEPIPGEET